jgi:hypothetical protein
MASAARWRDAERAAANSSCTVSGAIRSPRRLVRQIRTVGCWWYCFREIVPQMRVRVLAFVNLLSRCDFKREGIVICDLLQPPRDDNEIICPDLFQGLIQHADEFSRSKSWRPQAFLTAIHKGQPPAAVLDWVSMEDAAIRPAQQSDHLRCLTHRIRAQNEGKPMLLE